MNTTQSSTPLPHSDTVLTHMLQEVLFVTLNDPQTRHALSPEIIQTLSQVVDFAQRTESIRALVIRGSGGFFCAGGNLGSFNQRLSHTTISSSTLADDPIAAKNREFGYFMQALAQLTVPIIAVVEGAAMGGGMGLACSADIVLATQQARFALSETSLGIIPAQIAPFVVTRLGQRLTQRLSLTGLRLSGEQAMQLGMVDRLATDSNDLDRLLAEELTQLCRCAPIANRRIKTLLRDSDTQPLDALLDESARQFAACMREEGALGIAAFRNKALAPWCCEFTTEAIQRVYSNCPASRQSS